MFGALNHRQSPRDARRWYPAGLLACGLLLALFAALYLAHANQTRNLAEIETIAQESQAAVRTRMAAYVALLRGGAAFLAGSKRVERTEFRSFVNLLNIPKRYPGIQAYAFSVRLTAEGKDEAIARLRQDGLPGFQIWPDHEREEYHTIVFIEPFDKRNAHALGFDMFTEPVRRAAMSQARDEGVAVASGVVTLVQEIDGPRQPGFLIYMPVYAGGQVPDSVEERRAALVGFIYCAFRADDLFQEVLPPIKTVGVFREIYDGAAPARERLLHSAGPPDQGSRPPEESSLSATLVFEFATRPWSLRVIASESYKSMGWVPWAVFGAGAALFLMLFYLTRSQLLAQIRAEEAAARLRVSEQSLREAREELQAYTRELEQRVDERTARLQESIQSLEGVLYHVAHDLRAPLRAMASFTSLLEQDYPDRLDEKGADYVRRIAAAARRMDELVRDLLAYGRLAHSAMPLATVDPEETLNAVINSMAGFIQTRRAEVRVAPPLPAVQANAHVLREILENLLENALKFVPEGTAPRVLIRSENGGRIRLWVEDNGIGISREHHERIFRMFERLHSNEAYSGTGIGLAIVQKGVERMGGKVGVASEAGQGSRFWIELPAAAGAN